MRLKWDQIGAKTYETGIEKGVLYPMGNDGKYGKGVSWSGLVSVTESPSGAEATPIYADNIKYLNLMSKEEYGATIEAYTYPKEFEQCDGSAEIAKGVTIGQQDRKMFGLCYRTILGNDTENEKYGYKLHLIYGAQAAPTEKNYSSTNESTEPMTMSWELSTTPVEVEGYDVTASVTIDSTSVDADKLSAFEDIIYGTDTEEARLPLPNDVMVLMGVTQAAG